MAERWDGRSPSGRRWVLNHGSCVDAIAGLCKLPDRCVTHTITDPPYEGEAHTEQRRQHGKRAGAYVRVSDVAPLDFDPMTEEERAEVSAQISRVTVAWVALFCQVEAIHLWRRDLERGGMIYRRTIPWCKPDAMPAVHGRWPGQAFESIILLQKPKAQPCPGGGKSVYYQHTRARPGQPGGPSNGVGGDAAAALHPTTKPLNLMLDLVELVSNPGDVILDPYVGSGTTGVAALMRGRDFLGWELQAKYAEIARRALAGEERKPTTTQPSLFGGAA